MWRGALTTLLATGALVICSTSTAAGVSRLTFGVADDHGKYADDAGAAFDDELTAAGLTTDRFTVTWDPASPRTIPERTFLDRAIPTAKQHGVSVVLSVRPVRANAIGGSLARAKQFATYLGLVAKAYPSVATIIVANEPNQPRFWQPQFSGRTFVAGRLYERLLALSYDALKKANPKVVVAGAALSGRGNDNPAASSNRSTSPLRFIYDMGAAYRASKRTKPLMDVFSFHPYPRSSLDSLAKGLEWPMAGYANLNRVKQSLWDAFNGTAQKTTANGLGIMIDEVGWQVRIPDDSTDYTGAENVPVTTEAHQAQVYGQLIRSAVCDPAVKSLLFMPFIDETDLAGFQSGLERADGTKRPAYDSVKAVITSTKGRCLGRLVRWAPVKTVIGARAYFHGLALPKTKKQLAWNFGVRTGEDARYVATIMPAPSRTTLDPGTPAARPLLRAKGVAKANWTPLIRFPKHSLPQGRYVYRVELSALFNPLRSRIIVSHAFVVH
jgi:hypothetical protein